MDSIKRSGVEYDFSARKIFPLLEDVGLDLAQDFHTNVVKLLRYASTHERSGEWGKHMQMDAHADTSAGAGGVVRCGTNTSG